MPERPNNYRWLVFPASFFFPFFGFAYGVVELCKPEREDVRRGKVCITLGVVAMILTCAGAVALMAAGIKTGFEFS